MVLKSTGKTKKRLTIEEYIDNPTADVDKVIGKKQKISSKQWDIVHYFYQKLDNIHYLDHNQHQKELIFQKSEYVDTLIERVLTVNRKCYQDCTIKDEKDYYANEPEYQRKDGNRVICQ